MKRQAKILFALVSVVALLAILALRSREDAPPGQVAPDEAVHLK